MSDQKNTSQPANIFQVTSTLYGFMTVIGLLILYFVHENLSLSFTFSSTDYSPYQILSIGVLAAGVLLISSYYFELYFKGYKELRRHVMKMLGPTSAPLAVYLALASAIGEEILFRGAIQPAAGLLATSILFGLLHLGPDGRISTWSIWAFLSGLLLGWTYIVTSSLWPAILAHFTVNVFSIFRLRKKFRNLEPMVERLQELKKTQDERKVDQ